MLHQDVDFGPGRERRAHMRREVEHDRLDARLAAVRSKVRAAPEGAVFLKGPLARVAAVVATLLG